MSNLSPAEATAGISRQALATLQRNAMDAAPSTLQQKRTTEIISAYRCTRVLDTPMRLLDVLETRDSEYVILRETAYVDHKVGVTYIHMSRPESIALANIILQLEDFTPSAEKANGNGRQTPNAARR